MKKLSCDEIFDVGGGGMENCRCYDSNNEYVSSFVNANALECEKSICSSCGCAYWEYEVGGFSSTGYC